MPDTEIGFATLPDVGVLSYNGVTFSSLYRSRLSGVAVKDEAQRTVKYAEWTLQVEGVVTLKSTDATTDDSWANLRRKLNEQGAALVYERKGFGPLSVNVPGGVLKDVAWGPVPETLQFIPLGSSRSAMITWTCKTRIPEITGLQQLPLPRMLQFNEEIHLSYDEDHYSRMSVKGTLEIPLTRVAPGSRVVSRTVDDMREGFLDFVALFDPTRFRVTQRTFDYSRDKRTCQWHFQVEELPPMAPPPGATVARGTYSVRPMQRGYALCKWVCSLRCTYVIRKDFPRRMAWGAFVSLMAFRMFQSAFGHTDSPPARGVPGGLPPGVRLGLGLLPSVWASLFPGGGFAAAAPGVAGWEKRFLAALGVAGDAGGGGVAGGPEGKLARRAFPIHFGFDEGLYLDSKTVSFEASWALFTVVSHILLASGIWRTPLEAPANASLWATSLKDVQGWRSWEVNALNPASDVVIDLGGP